MKLNKQDNKHLLYEACIVKEMECYSKNHIETAKKFAELKEVVHNSKNITFQDLTMKFYNIPSITNFLNYIEDHKKSTINRKYYNTAVKIAKENNKNEEFTSQIRDKFFNEHRIKNLKVRLNRQKLKLFGASIPALLAAGALYLSNPPVVEPEPQSKTEYETTTEEPTTPFETPTTSGIEIDINSNNFYNQLLSDFKSLYATEYNSINNSNLDENNFALNIEYPNTVWQVKINDEYKYITHGNYPNNIESYFAENNLEAKTVNCNEAFSIYSIDSDKNSIKDYDEFGNLEDVKLDSFASIITPEGEYKDVILYNGNNPSELFEDKTSALTDLYGVAHTLTYSEYGKENKEALLSEYNKAVKEYHDSNSTYHINIENKDKYEKEPEL